MTLKQAFFILRHGSAEGNHKYLEAVKVIEDDYNRQKAEIERLEQNLKEAHIDIKEHLAEIENLEIIKEHLVVFLAEARAEAVKEFAERLKEKAYVPKPYGKSKVVDEYEIDNLVKEFTELPGSESDQSQAEQTN